MKMVITNENLDKEKRLGYSVSKIDKNFSKHFFFKLNLALKFIPDGGSKTRNKTVLIMSE